VFQTSIVKDDDGSDDNESTGSIEIITEGDIKNRSEEAPNDNGDTSQNSNIGWNNQTSGPMFGGYFNGNQNGLSGMDWSQAGGLNPMMQMQMQMQPNMMMNGNWGFQNMMGSSSRFRRNRATPNLLNTGMNPMNMAQGMFGGFGMQGMDMMGMDFNPGFGGWNNGPQMSSDFGAGNIYGNGAGYNSSHQGQYFQRQPKNNYQNRFHGHGSFQPRRGSGQPNAAQQINRGEAVNEEKQPLSEVPNNHPDGTSKDAPDAQQDADANSQLPISNDDEVVRDVADPSANATLAFNHDDANTTVVAAAQDDTNATDPNSFAQSTNQDTVYTGKFDQSYMNNQTNSDFNHNLHSNFNDQSIQTAGYDYSFNRGRGRGRFGFHRGGFRGRGGFHQQHDHYQVVTPQPSAVGVGVEGAPTGPKAMREGLPNIGFRGRGGFHGTRGGGHQRMNSNISDQQDLVRSDQLPASEIAKDAEAKTTNESPQHLERAHSHSRSRSKSPEAPVSKADSRSRSEDRRANRSKRHRSRSASNERYDYERENNQRKEKRPRREREDEHATNGTDKARKHDRGRDLSRDNSPEFDRAKHRSSRYEKEQENNYSSRSKRDSSKDRRKNRHRSKSPKRDEALERMADVNGDFTESSERSRADKYRERERDSEKDRDENRNRRARSRDHDREKHRNRDRDRSKKRSRRDDRSPSMTLDDHHRSTRSSRREREPGRRQGRDSKADPGQPLSHDDFKISGRSHLNSTSTTQTRAPPTGPSKAPPTGPRALLDKLARAAKAQGQIPTGPSSRRSSIQQQQASTEPTPPPAPSNEKAADPHTLEREARNRERLLKERQRRQQLADGSNDRKRSFADANGEARGNTGERERRKKSRRVMNVKYEDEENDEARARRVEREREASRWN
jgi:zinc finger CCCH domain-containing protein 13